MIHPTSRNESPLSFPDHSTWSLGFHLSHDAQLLDVQHYITQMPTQLSLKIQHMFRTSIPADIFSQTRNGIDFLFLCCFLISCLCSVHMELSLVTKLKYLCCKMEKVQISQHPFQRGMKTQNLCDCIIRESQQLERHTPCMVLQLCNCV